MTGLIKTNPQTISIQGADVTRVEYRGEPVVTFAMVDSVHQRPGGTARRNFNENRERFVESEDFVELTANEIRTQSLGSVFAARTGKGIVLTRRGYLKLTKPMNDDRAWAVQGDMIDRYFVTEAAATALGELSAEARSAIGGIVKRCTGVVVREELHELLAALLPQAVHAFLADRNIMVRRGCTAQQILDRAGTRRGIKGLTLWVGNRMDALGFRMNGTDKADRGNGSIRLYDPDKAEAWLRSGGRHLIEQKVAERKGQGRLRLVG